MKAYSVVFTPRAERQLANLYAYIANQSGVKQAENFVEAIVDDCRSLSAIPQRGVKRDDIRPNLRVKGYARRASIAFSISAESAVVTIHGVFYGGQDFEPLLRDADNDN